MVQFGEFLKIWSLRSNSVTRQVSFNRTKIGGKCQKETFWVIFKQCAVLHLFFLSQIFYRTSSLSKAVKESLLLWMLSIRSENKMKVKKKLNFTLTQVFLVDSISNFITYPVIMLFFVAGDPTPFVIYHDSWRPAFRRLSNPTITSNLAYSGWLLGSLYPLFLPPVWQCQSLAK